MLIDNYTFDKNNVKKLTNSQTTHKNIKDQLVKYKEELTKENDALLIYFAEHGEFDKDDKTGYIFPYNIKKEDGAFNQSLDFPRFKNLITAIKARYVLFMSLD